MLTYNIGVCVRLQKSADTYIFSIDYKNYVNPIFGRSLFLLPSNSSRICSCCFKISAETDGSSPLDFSKADIKASILILSLSACAVSNAALLTSVLTRWRN